MSAPVVIMEILGNDDPMVIIQIGSRQSYSLSLRGAEAQLPLSKLLEYLSSHGDDALRRGIIKPRDITGLNTKVLIHYMSGTIRQKLSPDQAVTPAGKQFLSLVN